VQNLQINAEELKKTNKQYFPLKCSGVKYTNRQMRMKTQHSWADEKRNIHIRLNGRIKDQSLLLWYELTDWTDFIGKFSLKAGCLCEENMSYFSPTHTPTPTHPHTHTVWPCVIIQQPAELNFCFPLLVHRHILHLCVDIRLVFVTAHSLSCIYALSSAAALLV